VLNTSRATVPKPAMGLPIPDINAPPAAETESDEPLVAPIEESESANRRNGSGTAKTRSPVVLDLNLKSAKVSLKEFCDSKSVGDNDSRRYLVSSAGRKSCSS
jgi:hypothetical protein